MNAETFYDEFKAALRYLGLSWGEMRLATVNIQGDMVVVTYGPKSAAFQVKV